MTSLPLEVCVISIYIFLLCESTFYLAVMPLMLVLTWTKCLLSFISVLLILFYTVILILLLITL